MVRTNKKRSKPASIYIRQLSPSLKTTFKAMCAQRDETMERVIGRLIALYVSNPVVIESTDYSIPKGP